MAETAIYQVQEPKQVRVLVGMSAKGAHGGINACERPFIEELRRQGIEVREEIYSYKDKPAHLGERIARVLRTARRFRRLLKVERFDIIHLNTSFDRNALLRDVATVSLLRANGARIFVKFHGSDACLLEKGSGFLRLIVNRLLSRVDGVGLLSSEERDNFVREGLDRAKLFVVKNVVTSTSSGPDPSFAERWNIDAARPSLLFIARFIPAKGLIDVIRACRIVRDSGVQFTLLCVGDGPARQQAEEEVVKANLQSHVRFLGFIDEERTDEFYANSSMLVFPTHSEGFSMVIFRSIAAGMPVITTRIRAAADYLRAPDNCLWVEARAPEMLAERISLLLNDAKLRETMSANNRILAQQFAANIVAPEYVSIYRQLIAPKEESRRPGEGLS